MRKSGSSTTIASKGFSQLAKRPPEPPMSSSYVEPGAESKQMQTCANCAAPVSGRFCQQCGQETGTELKGVREWGLDLGRRYLARDGLLRATFSALFLAPGKLTVAYLAGKRRSYLRPFQLYLYVSVIVFALVQWFGLNLVLHLYGDHGVQILRTSAPQAAAAHASPVQLIIDHIDIPAMRSFKSMSAEERFHLVGTRKARYASYFILLLVPLYALAVMVCYLNRRRRYAEHLVFGLHTHVFFLLTLLLEALLPAMLASLISLWMLVYFMFALKRVYAGTWLETTLRGTAILGIFYVIYSLANFLLIFALVRFQEVA
jgi:hypothetical protein